MDLKSIEQKLNSFTDKLNELGEQVSDALNKGTTSFDNTLNSCVNSLDEKIDAYAQKKEQEKLEKGSDVKEVIETNLPNEPIPQPILQPIMEGTGIVDGVSITNTVKPNIGVDLNKNDDSSVLNQSSLDAGVNTGVKLTKEEG